MRMEKQCVRIKQKQTIYYDIILFYQYIILSRMEIKNFFENHHLLLTELFSIVYVNYEKLLRNTPVILLSQPCTAFNADFNTSCQPNKWIYNYIVILTTSPTCTQPTQSHFVITCRNQPVAYFYCVQLATRTHQAEAY